MSDRYPPYCGPQEFPWLPGMDVSGPVPGQLIRPMPGFGRIVRVSGLEEIDGGDVGTAVTLTWQYPLLVVAMMVDSLGDGSDEGLSSLGMKIQVGDGQQQVMYNGTAADFVTFKSIVGRQMLPAPIMRRVHQSEQWQIQCNNYNADTAFTPEIAFYCRDPKEWFGEPPVARAPSGRGPGPAQYLR